MKIFTAIYGEDVKKIDGCVSGIDESTIRNRAKELKEDGQTIGMLESDIDRIKNKKSLNFCGHESWNLIDHNFDGLVFRCKKCRIWIFFDPASSLLKVVNLENNNCPDCDGVLFPVTPEINKCTQCQGFLRNGKFIPSDVIKSITK